MEFKELRDAAMDCLKKAFEAQPNDAPHPHVVAAAASIVLSTPPKE